MRPRDILLVLLLAALFTLAGIGVGALLGEVFRMTTHGN